MAERYQFTNRWTMQREESYTWVLRNENGRKMDEDQYRHDIIERHNLIVDRHDEP